jgi:hypothetical protein
MEPSARSSGGRSMRSTTCRKPHTEVVYRLVLSLAQHAAGSTCVYSEGKAEAGSGVSTTGTTVTASASAAAGGATRTPTP